jgi:hypothetical protein
MEINSKKLKKLSETLVEVEKTEEFLNSGFPTALEFTGAEGASRFILSVDPDDKAVSDLSNAFLKSLSEYKVSLERKIRSIVRP